MKLIQITDSHLFAEPGQKLIGVDTEKSLRAVVDLVATEQDVAAIYATGDLSQDGSLESYELFARILQPLALPLYWIPGNHDNPKYFHEPGNEFPLGGRKLTELGNWRILMLDSVVAGDEYGHLEQSELDYIEKNVHDDGKHYMLIMHHQPVACGTAWLDTMQVDNSDEFMNLLAEKPSIRAVVNGHIHMDMVKTLNGVQFISTPSTCFQFTPYSDDFSIDNKMPGYRRIILHDDGTLETEVIRLQDYDISVDTSIDGY
jgi:Icc protein